MLASILTVFTVLIMTFVGLVVIWVVKDAFTKREQPPDQRMETKQKVTRISPPGRFTAGESTRGKSCFLCHDRFYIGELLSSINPVPADREEEKKRDEGKYYTAKVELAHEFCVAKALRS